ncbi:MAG: divalent-cation tolerance protein CutA [Patescibacteria group bacterium]
MILVYVICKDIKEGRKVGFALLKNKLVACYNLWPIESACRWQSKIAKNKEAALLLKTVAKNYPSIEKLVKKCHSYQVPCIFSIKPDRIEKHYIQWLKTVTK